jgi:hypothetical protein
MTGSTMTVRDWFGEISPLLGLSRTRDALTAYVGERWPVGRRKSVMREWDLSEDEARSVCTGRCSWATWDKIVNHKNGRWSVILPVIGALLDEPVEQFIIQKRKAHAERAERLGALVSDLWALPADPRLPADNLDQRVAERRQFDGRRVGGRQDRGS